MCYVVLSLKQKEIVSSDMSFPLQKFLQVKVNPNTYWIGLSCDARKNKWQWIDEEPSKL